MNLRPRWAVAVLTVGIGSVLWAILGGDEPPVGALFVAAAAAPVAVLLAVLGRSGGRFLPSALLGGAVVGPGVAIAGHAVAFACAAGLLLGFLDSGRRLLESLQVDPRISDLLSSPWLLVLLVDVVAVAPLTEETGKALGARAARPSTRRDAFAAGVAAGTGFAIVENALYAVVAAAFGGPWPALVIARAMGAAVHPLASGLVVVGWWDARHGSSPGAMGRGFLSGVGVHAAWNASMVALAAAGTAVHVSGASALMRTASLAFTGALGVVAAAALWSLAGSVRAEPRFAFQIRASEAGTVAGWILLSASLLVPVAILVVAFPSVYLG